MVQNYLRYSKIVWYKCVFGWIFFFRSQGTRKFLENGMHMYMIRVKHIYIWYIYVYDAYMYTVYRAIERNVKILLERVKARSIMEWPACQSINRALLKRSPTCIGLYKVRNYWKEFLVFLGKSNNTVFLLFLYDFDKKHVFLPVRWKTHTRSIM